MIDETKQYYGPGGDFIPFSGVVYNEKHEFSQFYMNERVDLITSRYFERPRTYIKGLVMGRITKFVLGVGLVETFIIEMPDGSREIVSRFDFTKENLSEQRRMRKKALNVWSEPQDMEYLGFGKDNNEF